MSFIVQSAKSWRDFLENLHQEKVKDCFLGVKAPVDSVDCVSITSALPSLHFLSPCSFRNDHHCLPPHIPLISGSVVVKDGWTLRSCRGSFKCGASPRSGGLCLGLGHGGSTLPDPECLLEQRALMESVWAAHRPCSHRVATQRLPIPGCGQR